MNIALQKSIKVCTELTWLFKIVNSTSAVKYIYKYILKGNDRIIVEPKASADKDDSKPKVRNEVQQFIDGRYISPTMAIWNIYG